MILHCCGKVLITGSTRMRDGRRALKARCPVCSKVKFKILEPKHANKVEQP